MREDPKRTCSWRIYQRSSKYHCQAPCDEVFTEWMFTMIFWERNIYTKHMDKRNTYVAGNESVHELLGYAYTKRDGKHCKWDLPLLLKKSPWLFAGSRSSTRLSPMSSLWGSPRPATSMLLERLKTWKRFQFDNGKLSLVILHGLWSFCLEETKWLFCLDGQVKEKDLNKHIFTYIRVFFLGSFPKKHTCIYVCI